MAEPGPKQRTKAQVWTMVKSKFRTMQLSINAAEKEIMDGEELNKAFLSFHIGKLYSDFRDVGDLLDIWEPGEK